jgi:hypothetical protein
MSEGIMKTQREHRAGIIVEARSDITEDPLWRTISGWKLPFGTDYLAYKYKWDEEFAALAIAEYRRFAFLALTGNSESTPSLSIDEVWHVHILHTADYQRFGNACGRTLHHSPGMPSQAPTFDLQYEETLRRYKERFGREAPALVWPRQKSSTQESAPSLRSVQKIWESIHSRFDS